MFIEWRVAVGGIGDWRIPEFPLCVPRRRPDRRRHPRQRVHGGHNGCRAGRHWRRRGAVRLAARAVSRLLGHVRGDARGVPAARGRDGAARNYSGAQRRGKVSINVHAARLRCSTTRRGGKWRVFFFAHTARYSACAPRLCAGGCCIPPSTRLPPLIIFLLSRALITRAPHTHTPPCNTAIISPRHPLPLFSSRFIPLSSPLRRAQS